MTSPPIPLFNDPGRPTAAPANEDGAQPSTPPEDILRYENVIQCRGDHHFRYDCQRVICPSPSSFPPISVYDTSRLRQMYETILDQPCETSQPPAVEETPGPGLHRCDVIHPGEVVTLRDPSGNLYEVTVQDGDTLWDIITREQQEGRTQMSVREVCEYPENAHLRTSEAETDNSTEQTGQPAGHRGLDLTFRPGLSSEHSLPPQMETAPCSPGDPYCESRPHDSRRGSSGLHDGRPQLTFPSSTRSEPIVWTGNPMLGMMIQTVMEWQNLSSFEEAIRWLLQNGYLD